MSFRDQFISGNCNLEALGEWVKIWHSGAAEGESLRDFLGLSHEEYQMWVAQGDEALAKMLAGAAVPQYVALHLGWDELGDKLETLVKSLLGADYEITISRIDYYYWEMRLNIPVDVDEAYSRQICEKLGLHDVEPDFFTWREDVENENINGLLSMLVNREVDSNHADDHGIWIICREYRASSQEYAAGLISRCEKRLRREIHSNHYPIVNKDTAAHQLFGFKEALKLLGLIPENQWTVDPEYFYDKHSTPVDPQ